MSEGFDPFAPAEGAVMFTGRPFRANRATVDRGPDDAGSGAGCAGQGLAAAGAANPAGLEERLTLVEAELVSLRLRLETVDHAVTNRLNDQTARLLLAVADLVGGRGPAQLPERKKPPRKARIVW